MNTIFVNSSNSKTSDPHRLLLNFTDEIDFIRKDKYIALSNLAIYYAWKNIKKSNKSNKFKISARTWNEKFELFDGSYSLSDIHDHFEYILNKHGGKTINPSIRRYINKIENRITFEIKTEYYRQVLFPETMKLRKSIISKITKDENGQNVPYLEITEVLISVLL